MRILSAILSIYILFLTAVPCCLYENCEKEQSHVSGKQSQDHNDTDDTDGCSACSPFFCHSCSGCIIATFHFQPSLVQDVTNGVYNGYVPVFIPAYIPFLWQPPDIA